MFIEKLTDKEIILFAKNIDKKYKLCSNLSFSLPYRKFKILERNNEEVRVLLASKPGYLAQFPDETFEIVLRDFDMFSLHIYGNDILETTMDFYAFMYNKFGEEYLQNLKAQLTKAKNERIEEEIKEIEEEYQEIFTELNKKINKVKKIKKSNDIEDILENFKNDLKRFPTTEEKVEYLKSFGFNVKVKKDDENLEK